MKKNFVTVRRYGYFVTEIPNNETVIYDWIRDNVPPLYNLNNTTRGLTISDFYSFHDVMEIAKKQGYTFTK